MPSTRDSAMQQRLCKSYTTMIAKQILCIIPRHHCSFVKLRFITRGRVRNPYKPSYNAAELEHSNYEKFRENKYQLPRNIAS